MHNEFCRLAVRTLQSVNKLHKVVSSYRCGRQSSSTTAGFCKEAEWLTATGTVQECILLSIGESLAELVNDVVF